MSTVFGVKALFKLPLPELYQTLHNQPATWTRLHFLFSSEPKSMSGLELLLWKRAAFPRPLEMAASYAPLLGRWRFLHFRAEKGP